MGQDQFTQWVRGDFAHGQRRLFWVDARIGSFANGMRRGDFCHRDT